MESKSKLVADKTSSDMISLMLKQIGARLLRSDPAYISIFEFELDEDTKLRYMLNIHRDGYIYVHRVTPYPMVLGKFYGETDVVDFIRRDYKKMLNAHNTYKFGRFLELADDLQSFNRQIEQLFMNRKIPVAAFDEFSKEMEKMRETLEKIVRESPVLFEDEELVDFGGEK